MTGLETPGSATGLDPEARLRFAAIADHLIPQAHGMPSAREVVDERRLGFVLGARPDLVEPLRASLRAELGDDVAARLETLAQQEPGALAALQLVIVGGYYTDKGVRDLIGYHGQEAIEVKSWRVPEYLDEGLIDVMLARGAVWRDPDTGKRAVVKDAPRTYAERFAATTHAEGGHDGHDRT